MGRRIQGWKIHFKRGDISYQQHELFRRETLINALEKYDSGRGDDSSFQRHGLSRREENSDGFFIEPSFERDDDSSIHQENDLSRRGGIAFDACLSTNLEYDRQHNLPIPPPCLASSVYSSRDIDNDNNEPNEQWSGHWEPRAPTNATTTPAAKNNDMTATWGTIGAISAAVLLVSLVIYFIKRRREKKTLLEDIEYNAQNESASDENESSGNAGRGSPVSQKKNSAAHVVAETKPDEKVGAFKMMLARLKGEKIGGDENERGNVVSGDSGPESKKTSVTHVSSETVAAKPDRKGAFVTMLARLKGEKKVGVDVELGNMKSGKKTGAGAVEGGEQQAHQSKIGSTNPSEQHPGQGPKSPAVFATKTDISTTRSRIFDKAFENKNPSSKISAYVGKEVSNPFTDKLSPRPRSNTTPEIDIITEPFPPFAKPENTFTRVSSSFNNPDPDSQERLASLVSLQKPKQKARKVYLESSSRASSKLSLAKSPLREEVFADGVKRMGSTKSEGGIPSRYGNARESWAESMVSESSESGISPYERGSDSWTKSTSSVGASSRFTEHFEETFV